MERRNKILIVIIAVLVIVIGIVGYLAYQNYRMSEMDNSSIVINKTNNNTTPTETNSTMNTTTQSNQTHEDQGISASQAIVIANERAATYDHPQHATGEVDYVDTGALPGNPYWKVYLISDNWNKDHITGFMFIDSVTGEIRAG